MGNRVFLVHGRNRGAKQFLTGMLDSLGVSVLDWEGAVHLSGKPSPHAHDVLRTAMGAVDAVVVLMSDDEEARLKPELCDGAVERHYESILQPQSRLNVIFEAGIAFALFPEKTILVQLGRLRQISDLSGIQYVPLDGTQASTHAFINRLRNTGCVPSAKGHVMSIAFKPPDANLPTPVPVKSDQKGAIGLFRRLKSFIPMPGFGNSLEIAGGQESGSCSRC